jgi:hypothetical protein
VELRNKLTIALISQKNNNHFSPYVVIHKDWPSGAPPYGHLLQQVFNNMSKYNNIKIGKAFFTHISPKNNYSFHPKKINMQPHPFAIITLVSNITNGKLNKKELDSENGLAKITYKTYK